MSRGDCRSRPRRILLAAVLIAGGPALHAANGAPAPSRDRLPTVGDPIELRFELAAGESIVIDRSDRFELVSMLGGDVVIRSFEPGSFTVEARVGSPRGERIERREVIVGSILGPEDDLEPSPLEPPWSLPPNRAARASLAVSALAALAGWILLVRRARALGSAVEDVAEVSILEDYRSALRRIRRMPPGDERLIALAEITRSFLVRLDPPVGRELTTREVAESLEARLVPAPAREIVREILDEGDFAKFSGWGGRLERFDDLSARAGRVVEVSGTGGETS